MEYFNMGPHSSRYDQHAQNQEIYRHPDQSKKLDDQLSLIILSNTISVIKQIH